jgi:hypothetical protein
VQEESTIRERLIRNKQERQINHLQQQVQQLQQGTPGSSEGDREAITVIKPPKPMNPQDLTALVFDSTIDSAVEKLSRTKKTKEDTLLLDDLARLKTQNALLLGKLVEMQAYVDKVGKLTGPSRGEVDDDDSRRPPSRRETTFDYEVEASDTFS